MDVDDRTVISEEELGAALGRLVALVQGLESATHSCTCGRYYRLGMSTELQSVLVTIRRAVHQRTGEDIAADTSRFALLEVD
jgi:hypothetical protein